MALPGVKTVLRDQFRTTSRSDIPNTTKVGGTGRRGNQKIALASSDDTWYSETETWPDTDTPVYRYYTNRRAGHVETDFDDSPIPAARDWEAVRIRNEQEAIDNFDSTLNGNNPSELRRCYNDLVAGGAARVWLIAAPPDLDDTQLVNTDNLSNLFNAVELEELDILALHGRGGSTSAGWDDTTNIGYYADDGSSVVENVAGHCKTITDRSNPVIATMGVQPASADEEGLTAGELSTHLNLSDLPSNDLDDGAYVNIVITEIRPAGSPDAEYSNGAAFYAGFISSLDAEIAPTGKTVYNVDEMRYIPTRSQQGDLIDLGVVPVGVSQNRTPKIIDGQTFAKEGSDFQRLSTLRIVFDAIRLVRQVAERFIGMPATLHHRNALETDITSNLRGMVTTGALLEADFSVDYIPRENRAVIDLILRPAFELRNIEVRVAIQL